MMRQMRENTKWIMLVTALAFVALMVFEWGMDMSGQSAGGTGQIGTVNGVPVNYEQYYATYRNLYDQAQQQQEAPLTSQQNREIEDQAWNEVVNQILIQQELRRRGIRVTDEEIRQAALYSPPPMLRQAPVFQTDGRFDLRKYQDFLASGAADEELLLQLESYYRDVIPRSKLMRQVTSGMYITDAELWQAYRDQHEQVRVSYVALDPIARIPDQAVQVSDAEVRAYYEANQEDFEVPARATVRAVVMPTTATAADTAATLERAREIRDRIVQEGEDFAEVARAESADEGSAQAGGDLGWFARGDMVAPFEEAAFAADVGEVTEPVRSRFGFHVIEVTERAADSVRARHVLVPVERTDESEMEMLTRADSLEALLEGMTMQEAARTLGLEVREAEITDAFPFLGGAGQIDEGAEWAFEEAQPGEVSPLFETEQAFYAIELIRRTPGGVMPLEEARPTIRQILVGRAKLERAREEGRGLVQAVRGGTSLEEAAGQRNLRVQEAGPFARTDFVPGLGRVNAAIGAPFGLEVGEVSDVVVTDDNAFVMRLLEHMPADSSLFVAQKELLRAQYTQGRQEERLQQWLEGLREQAEIVDRREEVLQPADEEEQGGFGFPAY